MAEKPKILVCDPLADEGLNILRQAGEVEVATGLSEAQLIERVPGYAAVLVRSGTKITAPIIEAADQLRIIARAGVGVDNIDVEAATRHGVLVVNSPGGNTISTAEHAIAMMLALARKIPQAQQSLASGKWERKKFLGRQVTGKTLGIIGLGRIGSEVARRARGLEMQVLAFDPFVSEDYAASLGVSLVDMEKLLESSDFVTLHASLTEATRGLIGAEQLTAMKPTACLINCARGGLIDDQALGQALDEGQLAGAALDVYPQEPPDDFSLMQRPEVVATPHIAASTVEAQLGVAVDAAAQVVAVLKGEPARWPVNAPALPAEEAEEIQRYQSLIQGLARVQQALVGTGLRRVELQGGREMKPERLPLLMHHFLAALLQGQTELPVNFINSTSLARERGIEIAETTAVGTSPYGLRLEALTTDSEGEGSAAAVLLENDRVHLVEIAGFHCDVEMAGKLMILWNSAPGQPGFIGRLGTLLGESGVSIQGIQVASGLVEGRGLLLVQLEQELTDDLAAQVAALPGVARIEWVEFSQ